VHRRLRVFHHIEEENKLSHNPTALSIEFRVVLFVERNKSGLKVLFKSWTRTCYTVFPRLVLSALLFHVSKGVQMSSFRTFIGNFWSAFALQIGVILFIFSFFVTYVLGAYFFATFLGSLLFKKQPVVAGLLVLGVNLPILLYLKGLWRQKQYERMARPSCLLCDSHSLRNLDETDYICKSCGYDTRLLQYPSISERVEKFRDVKFAFDALKEGEDLLSQAQYMAGGAVINEGHSGGLIHERFNDGLSRLLEGQRFLHEYVEKHPEILQTPQHDDDLYTLFEIDFYVIDHMLIDIEILRKISEFREKVKPYIEGIQKLLETSRKDILEAGKDLA